MIIIPKTTPYEQLINQDTSKNFAIFSSENNYYSLSQMAEIYHAVHGNDSSQLITDLVAFRPKRILEHEIIIALTTRVKLNNLDEDLYEKFLLIKQLINIDNFITLGNHIHQQNLIATDVQINHNYIPGQFIQDISLNTIKMLINSATSTNKDLRASAREIVEQAIIQSNLETLPEYPLNERVTFIISGAIASGKGTLETIIKDHVMNDYGLAWNSLIKFNGDKYKLLLNPNYAQENSKEKLSLFSQLTQDEITIIGKEINNRLVERIELTGKAANVYLDKSFLNKKAIEIATINGGAIKGLLITLSIEEALIRAENRGAITGRYEDTHSILAAHSTTATKFIDLLTNHRGKSIDYIIYDNKVPLGTQPIKAAKVDLKTKEILVYNQESFSNFFNKSNLDVNQSLETHEIIYGDYSLSESLLAGVNEAGYNIDIL